jgi:hypothetical protein
MHFVNALRAAQKSSRAHGSQLPLGEPDTSIAMYQQNGQRIIATETRIGKSVPPTIFHAEVVDSEGADVVKRFVLDGSFDEWRADVTQKKQNKQAAEYEKRIIEHLEKCDALTAPQEVVLAKVEGKRKGLLGAIQRLTDENVVSMDGVPHSPTNPLKLTLDREQLSLYYMSRGKLGKAAQTSTQRGLSIIGFSDDHITDDSMNAEDHVQ